ncbi:helix-turn-helix domain-containing protein [Clostridium estertheticum]|uniref:Excisionase n=1 Tax=Clostridium estertheticum subsp. estertheticum TaxID=1552 RepID=A0A1J0GED2_9CLOT|nr:helix-turn-helix domain-containing protein [Clostridium estertheticum]APC39651.1 excisionase [Clostridium estertheticum subsp. estertheticum]MBZ9614313.1 helix-turn-helix domain-containing protein [Clostridium estertheticum subsp. laramiense]WAG74250.1 helix-turn-helix domain-containing protein [Clostridium estertheticum]
MFNDYNDLLNVEELCEILGIGKNTVYDLLNSGELKSFREGRKWKIPKMAVEKYILEKSGLINTVT